MNATDLRMKLETARGVIRSIRRKEARDEKLTASERRAKLFAFADIEGCRVRLVEMGYVVDRAS